MIVGTIGRRTLSHVHLELILGSIPTSGQQNDPRHAGLIPRLLASTAVDCAGHLCVECLADSKETH